jgi:hypothetical protein
MTKIRCKNCNVELNSHPIKTKCCGCDNLTTITGEKISALDLTLVELINSDYKKDTKSVFSREDLEYQESRRNRKIRKLDFEIR